MRGKSHVRPAADNGLMPDWATEADPILAARVERDVRAGLSSGTRKDYDRVAQSFTQFCELRNLVPFPVNRFTLAMWIEYETMWISLASLTGTYLSAVKDAHECRGFTWELNADPLIRKTIRACMRRYGGAAPLEKFPLTLQIFNALAKSLPGWPNADHMSHNHRLWMAVCAVAIPGMLRGGEFLTSPRSVRPILSGDRLQTGVAGGVQHVEINVESPKATWWINSFPVKIVSPGRSCLICPVRWLLEYRRLAPMELTEAGPAFVMEDGMPASRNWWLHLTSNLVLQAGITILSRQGFPLAPRMSSCRCGGVDSAKQANVSDADIMGMGRWSSAAWLRYASSVRPIGLQAIAANMYGFTEGSSLELGLGNPVDLSVWDEMSEDVAPSGTLGMSIGDLCIAHLPQFKPEDICVFKVLGNGVLQWLKS